MIRHISRWWSKMTRTASALPGRFWRSRIVVGRKDLWLAVLVTVGLVGVGLYLGWDNNRVVTSYPMPGFHYLQEPHNPLTFFSNWDSADYLYIAREGYTKLFWVNWFPLYPIVIKLVRYVVPSYLDSAMLIAWTSLVGAIYFYIKIVRRLYGERDDFEPLRALMFFVLFPTGVFLIAPFSESLYAMLALGAIYFALQKRCLPAAVMALLCTATHITGPFVVVMVALLLYEEKVRWRNIVLTTVAGSLGLLTYMSFLYAKFDAPLAFFQSQQIYHQWTGHGLWNLVATATPSKGIAIIFLLVAAGYWWRRRLSFAVYSLMFLAILVAGRQYGGFDRYVLMAFPVQWMLYEYFRHKPKLFWVVTAVFGSEWTYYLLQYAGGYIGS